MSDKPISINLDTHQYDYGTSEYAVKEMRKSDNIYWMISNDRKLVLANSNNWKQITFSDSQVDDLDIHSLKLTGDWLWLVSNKKL